MTAAFVLLVSPAVAGRDPWLVAHARLSYPVFEPRQTLGFRLSAFMYLPCYHGRATDSVYTVYGLYNMSPSSAAHGFQLAEGSPQVCANAAEFTPHGTRMIDGVRADLGVYCAYPKRCALDTGFRNGFILYWTRAGTSVVLNSAHLSLTQLLAVASGLRQVRS